MRQTKFRVYCKGNHPTNLNFQKAGGWNLCDGILNKYYDMLAILSGRDDPEFNEHFELQQFTGYTSCRGQEVYEGDVVKFNSEYDYSKEGEGRVLYRDDLSCFTIKTSTDTYFTFSKTTIL